MANNDCTIVIDELALTALYRWLLSLGDDEPPADDEPRAEPQAAEVVSDDER
jgi:hypothetical protein